MRLSLPSALILLAGCKATAPTVALEGLGGDVWAFERQIAGEADPSCEQVWVESPRGRILADRDGERFAAKVPLVEGDNAVTALCTIGRKEHRSEAQAWKVRLDDRPTARVRVGYADEGMALDGGGSSGSEVRTAPIVSWSWTEREGNPEPLRMSGSGAALADGYEGRSLVVATPETDGEYYVNLTVTDADGETDTSTAVFRVWYGEALQVDTALEHPSWVDEAVVYGVVPFFYEDGQFSGVTERLDAIAALGATVLWLSPINDCPDDDFGYAVTDYFGIRDTFGSEEELRALIDGAHERGMRVIMDFVPNHTSDQHPYYRSAVSEGDRSPYHELYDRDESGEVTYYFEWSNLPNLDYDNPEVRRMMIEAFSYWVREWGVDGFRVDVAWGVHERAPDFWQEWRRELKRIDPDLMLLAEAGARDGDLFEHGFDVAYDWTWELGEWSWGTAWEDESATVSVLREALTNEGEGFHDDALVFRFLNNNDTGERFVTRYGAERVPSAAALMLTVPGVPMVYTGDEIGAEYEPYNEGPPVVWEDTHGLQAIYERLVRLRRDVPALQSRDWILLEPDPSDSVLAYVRPGETPLQSVLVVLNFTGEAVTAAVPVGSSFAAMVSQNRLQDLYSDGTVSVPDRSVVNVELDAYGVAILAHPDL